MQESSRPVVKGGGPGKGAKGPSDAGRQADEALDKVQRW